MEVRILKGATLALLTLATIANAQDKAQVKGINEVERISLCQSVHSLTEKAQKDNTDDAFRKAEQAAADCRKEAKDITSVLRAFGNEFIPVGYGRILQGADLNIFEVKKTGTGVRAAGGASAFLALDGRSAIDLRLTPTVIVGGFLDRAPYQKNFFEPQEGSIYYIAPVTKVLSTRTIEDFNGFYFGLGTEWMAPDQSVQNNKAFKVITVYVNPITFGIIVTYMTSLNGGKGEVGKNIQGYGMYINNFSASGSGYAVATPVYDTAVWAYEGVIEAKNKSLTFISDTTSSTVDKLKSIVGISK